MMNKTFSFPPLSDSKMDQWVHTMSADWLSSLLPTFHWRFSTTEDCCPDSWPHYRFRMNGFPTVLIPSASISCRPINLSPINSLVTLKVWFIQKRQDRHRARHRASPGPSPPSNTFLLFFKVSPCSPAPSNHWPAFHHFKFTFSRISYVWNHIDLDFCKGIFLLA